MSTAARQAKELLEQHEKKLTVLVDPEIHMNIKSMAAQNNLSMKDLIVEAYYEHLVPKYMKEIQ